VILALTVAKRGHGKESVGTARRHLDQRPGIWSDKFLLSIVSKQSRHFLGGTGSSARFLWAAGNQQCDDILSTPSEIRV
jgi:hypothetical protein